MSAIRATVPPRHSWVRPPPIESSPSTFAPTSAGGACRAENWSRAHSAPPHTRRCSATTGSYPAAARWS
ncbi:hypothetical protein ACFQZ4_11890 [Catellatospora coxensis]